MDKIYARIFFEVRTNKSRMLKNKNKKNTN